MYVVLCPQFTSVRCDRLVGHDGNLRGFSARELADEKWHGAPACAKADQNICSLERWLLTRAANKAEERNVNVSARQHVIPSKVSKTAVRCSLP